MIIITGLSTPSTSPTALTVWLLRLTFVYALTFLIIAGILRFAQTGTDGVRAAGGCLGFSGVNFYPAKVFMGDTGSLFFGGLVVAMAFDGGVPLLLVFAGVIYWCEAFSVILQVISFKTTGKRIFKMSPIHHHFEMSGWSEVKIVTVFSIVTLAGGVLAVLAVLQM
jgi:phospho-N-acetylmuramoyl-pentapeptide-transferase